MPPPGPGWRSGGSSGSKSSGAPPSLLNLLVPVPELHFTSSYPTENRDIRSFGLYATVEAVVDVGGDRALQLGCCALNVSGCPFRGLIRVVGRGQ